MRAISEESCEFCGLPKSAAQKSQDYVIFPQNGVSSDLSLIASDQVSPKY